jgi:hypothetical protein
LENSNKIFFEIIVLSKQSKFQIALDKLMEEKNKNYFYFYLLGLGYQGIVWCHLSSSDIKEIDTDTSPALKNNFVTFGSFNNLNKINDNVIKVCSSILNQVENSKIFI